MKHFLAYLLLVALPAICLAGNIELSEGVKLQANGDTIDDTRSSGHFVPTLADWNGNGKKDLIVGSMTGTPGNVRLYKNIGTAAEPKYDKGVYLEAGGQPIKLTGS